MERVVNGVIIVDAGIKGLGGCGMLVRAVVGGEVTIG